MVASPIVDQSDHMKSRLVLVPVLGTFAIHKHIATFAAYAYYL